MSEIQVRTWTNKKGRKLELDPVRFAHVLEGMLVIWVNGRRAGTPFDYYLRPQTP